MSKHIYNDRQERQERLKGEEQRYVDPLYSIALTHLIIDENKRRIKEAEIRKNHLEKMFSEKLRNDGGFEATVESGFNIKSGVIDFEITASKYCRSKYSRLSECRIIQLEKCVLYVRVCDTDHSEESNRIFDIIERCFLALANEAQAPCTKILSAGLATTNL